MHPLFRPEVANARSADLDGKVFVAGPISNQVFGWMFIAVAVFTIWYSTIVQLSRSEVVVGRVLPSAGVFRITVKDGGYLSKSSLREGLNVKAGQPVAVVRLSNSDGTDDYGLAMSDDLIDQKKAGAMGLQASIAKLEAERDDLANRIAGLQSRLLQGREKLALTGARIEIAQQDLDRVKQIAEKGYVSKVAVSEREAALLDLRDRAATDRMDILAEERELQEARSRLAKIPLEITSERASAGVRDAELNARLTDNQAHSVYTIKSPVSGTVGTIAAVAGETLPANATLAIITTGGKNETSAELLVPSRSIGSIKVGQEVRLKFDAFPYQVYGTGRGRVTRISDIALSTADIRFPASEIKEPVYRVSISVDEQAWLARSRSATLRPGMTVAADVIVAKHSLMAWFIKSIGGNQQ